jgi:hypothetical protein
MDTYSNAGQLDAFGRETINEQILYNEGTSELHFMHFTLRHFTLKKFLM